MTNPLSPPVAPSGQPTGWESFLLWFAANRRVIGTVLSTLGVLVTAHFEFQGHEKVGEILMSLALLVAGAYTAGAGFHRADHYWKEKKYEATLPPQARPPQRRKSDAQP